MKLYRLITILLLTAQLFACGPSRPVIPPGEIPSAPTVSGEDERYGQQVLAELSRQYPLSRDDQAINRTRDIVTKLAQAANAASSPWNVFVLQGDSIVNAAATRGNYVFVWTGLLRVARTDGELATVLAHEIGHLLAGHTKATAAEEASSIVAQASGEIASQILATQGPYGILAGVTGVLVTETIKAIAVNPESQRQELEADHIGFFLMADAGYDPQEAVSFWGRLATTDVPGAALQFLSTHPGNEDRMNELQRLMPEARRRYVQTTRRPPSSRTSPAARTIPSDGDSFSFGKDRPNPSRAAHWTVVEPRTPVLLTPFPGSRIVAELAVGTPVIIRSRTGRFYEISSPVQGFIPGVAISPP